MTAINGFIEPTRRAGTLGVHSLDHFSFAVPDLKAAQFFYGTFGLDVREAGDRLELFTAGGSHAWVSISQAARKALSYLSFGVYPEDLPRFLERFEAMGIPRLDPPAGLPSEGIWIRDCNNLLIELKIAEKSSPSAKTVFANPSTPAGIRNAPLRGISEPVRPRRLAHLLIFVRDVQDSIRFYSDVFGLRLSDQAGGGAFMHGIHGSDHHLVAFGQNGAAGMHHCSWDVGSVQEIGAGAMQMAAQGFSAGWGLGRHVLGSNYFHYVRDPWGGYSEYSADIDYIPSDMDWEGQSHAPENAFFLWGPEPPKDFLVNYERQ
jgi:catechol 2,3-dioxygenase